MHLTAMCWLCGTQISHSKLRRPADIASVKDVNVESDIVRPGTTISTKVGVCAIFPDWAKCKHFASHGHKCQHQHIEQRLSVARRRRDEEVERRILEIVPREKIRANWRRRQALTICTSPKVSECVKCLINSIPNH